LARYSSAFVVMAAARSSATRQNEEGKEPFRQIRPFLERLVGFPTQLALVAIS
jgi:hypothetical protein